MTSRAAKARLSAAPEASVVALAMARDDDAFEELVRRRQAMVRTLLLRLCGDPATAEDLAQETFLRAWRTIHGLQSNLALGAWLRQVAINVWLQHARLRRLATRPLVDNDAEIDARSAELSESDGGDRLDLQRALLRLGSAERLGVVLSYSEGMSHGEIVAVTGWPLGTVKSHVSRGAARLRALLQPTEAADE